MRDVLTMDRDARRPAKLGQERRHVIARREVGDVGLRRHIVEVHVRAQARGLYVKDVDHLG